MPKSIYQMTIAELAEREMSQSPHLQDRPNLPPRLPPIVWLGRPFARTFPLFFLIAMAVVACSTPIATDDPASDTRVSYPLNTLPAIPAFSGESIDQAVKDNVGTMAPRPTDEEIGLACQALHNVKWDYMSLGFRTNQRTVSIAAAITLYASGEQLVNYCKSKIGTDSTGRILPCPDVQNKFIQRVVELYQTTGADSGRIKSLSPVLESFQMEQYVQRQGGMGYSIQHEVQMDFIKHYHDGTTDTVTANGSMDVNDCSWTSVGAMSPTAVPTEPATSASQPTDTPVLTPAPTPVFRCSYVKAEFTESVFRASPNVTKALPHTLHIGPRIADRSGNPVHEVKMDFIEEKEDGGKVRLTAYGILSAQDCSWESVSVK